MTAAAYSNYHSSPVEIDSRTEAAARILAAQRNCAPDYPWKIGNGVTVPAWVVYVSEAVLALKQMEVSDSLRKLPKP